MVYGGEQVKSDSQQDDHGRHDDELPGSEYRGDPVSQLLAPAPVFVAALVSRMQVRSGTHAASAFLSGLKRCTFRYAVIIFPCSGRNMQQGDLETGIWSRPNRELGQAAQNTRSQLTGRGATVVGAVVRHSRQPRAWREVSDRAAARRVTD